MKSFTAMRTATGNNQMIAIQIAHAFGPSCSNRLMVGNENARAFGELHCRRDEDENEVEVIGC